MKKTDLLDVMNDLDPQLIAEAEVDRSKPVLTPKRAGAVLTTVFCAVTVTAALLLLIRNRNPGSYGNAPSTDTHRAEGTNTNAPGLQLLSAVQIYFNVPDTDVRINGTEDAKNPDKANAPYVIPELTAADKALLGCWYNKGADQALDLREDGTCVYYIMHNGEKEYDLLHEGVFGIEDNKILFYVESEGIYSIIPFSFDGEFLTILLDNEPPYAFHRIDPPTGKHDPTTAKYDPPAAIEFWAQTWYSDTEQTELHVAMGLIDITHRKSNGGFDGKPTFIPCQWHEENKTFTLTDWHENSSRTLTARVSDGKLILTGDGVEYVFIPFEQTQTYARRYGPFAGITWYTECENGTYGLYVDGPTSRYRIRRFEEKNNYDTAQVVYESDTWDFGYQFFPGEPNRFSHRVSNSGYRAGIAPEENHFLRYLMDKTANKGSDYNLFAAEIHDGKLTLSIYDEYEQKQMSCTFERAD